MIKIEIDKIIEKLKKTDEWKRYKNSLEKHLTDFNERNFQIEELIWKKWITGDEDELIVLKTTLKDWVAWWEWWKKESLIELFIKEYLKEVRICPYCGKIPLISYDNKEWKKRRTFDMDHIFAKESYPHLMYNFYNLIPICKICNNLKLTQDLSNSVNVFHPYYWLLVEGVSWKKYFNKKEFINNNFLNTEFINDDFLNNLNKENIRFYNLDKIYYNAQDTENDTDFILDKISKINTDRDKWGFFDIKERKEHYFKNFYPPEQKDTLKFSNGKLRRKLINEIKK